SIVMLCDIAEIARSAYYKWLKREPSKRERESEKLMKEITTLFQKVKGIYGYRRVTMTLNRRLGTSYNHKRIYRLMRVLGIQSIIR
ncbi:IS3 family transposase, partial [Sutcliffiella horikoshii]|uniref:IS3 family transposase n=1 Tax=Sutcliffiella horikoshii TaxID=79883 RepID=UPI003CF62C81